MNFPVMTDPWFYAVGIPAVLMMGLSKSGFGAGLGSLAVPLMALSVSVPQAAAIFMPLLLVMDLIGLAAFRRDVDKALLKFLLPRALLGLVLGALLFHTVQPRIVAGVVGVLTLLFLTQRLLFPPRADAPPMPDTWSWFFIPAAGFTSFVAHAGGPPYHAFMLSKRLSPVLFTATTAYLFFFVNVGKWLPYAWLGLLDMRNFATSLVLMPFAVIGTWIGVKIARQINPTWFYRIVYCGMFLTGCKLTYDGFIA